MNARFLSVCTLFLTAASSLACSSLLAGPAPSGPITLENLQGTPCGTWTAVARVPTHPIDWTLRVRTDDDASLQEVIVPAEATEVPIVQTASPGTHVVLLENALGPGPPATVEVPKPTIGLSLPADTWGPYPEREVPPFPVTLLTTCEDKSVFSAKALAKGTEVSPLQQADATTGVVELPFTVLTRGRHQVLIEAYGGGGVKLGERLVQVEVAPPCVDVDGDGVMACKGDCNDADPEIKPGIEDILGDNIDNNCDGVNGQDKDKDGAESSAVGGPDCDDDNPLIRGDSGPPDLDGDGYYPFKKLDWNCDGVAEINEGLFDCNDEDPRVPRSTELPDPNDLDDDCDGIIDEGTIAYDDDRDGQSEIEGDCNDADASIFSGATEVPDCKDNDCDEEIDEGVSRPSVDDRYEPNDEEAYKLPGAVKKKRFLNFDTGYKPTFRRMKLVTRGPEDVEHFSVWTHDGNIDSWHVTARAPAMGQGLSYDVEIEGGGRRVSGTITEQGQSVIMRGTSGDNTGTYTISVYPNQLPLTYCPLTLEVSSG